jgi:[ribosomal protein S5]-alanine N-acetyltransferase
MGSESSTLPAKLEDAPCIAADDLPAFDQVALQTQRLLLRPLREIDAPSLLTIFSDAKFMQFGTTPPWDSIDEAFAMIVMRFGSYHANVHMSAVDNAVNSEAVRHVDEPESRVT